jgi:hypothetical protein
MPRLLLDRLSPDCIQGFRAAARARYADGCILAEGEHRLAAIYLWGYAAEMCVKAAYFTLHGFGATQSIDAAALKTAAVEAKLYGIRWTNQHNLYAYASLVVGKRASLGRVYSSHAFANDFVGHAQTIYNRWRETLRYHYNQAYLFELERVRVSVEWLLKHMLEI